MPAFFEDYSSFNGTGEVNERGQDLKSFLEDYNANDYENPCVTTDILVICHKKGFCTVEQGLKLLMIKRKNHPCIGNWALPGGFVEVRENLEDSAKRELEEETNLKGIPLEQLYTWGDYKRDPRSRVITVSYLAMVETELLAEAGDDAADAIWVDVLLKKEETKEFVKDQRKKVKTNYTLELTNQEREFFLSAVVSEEKNVQGILKHSQYKVEKTKGIAVDHAAFIVQALQYIQGLIR